MHTTSPDPSAPTRAKDGVAPSRRGFLWTALVATGSMLVGTNPAGAALKKTTKKTAKKTTTKAASAATPTTKPATGTSAFASTQELVLSYSYAPTDSGFRVNNPFVAVWFEDLNGGSIRTLQVSYKPGKGLRWLPDLRRWYQADQVRQITGGTDLLATVSSATRLPGAFSLAWNGLDDQGTPVPPGDYLICIEAAREHGPYSLVKEKVTINANMAPMKLPDNGELVAVTATLQPKK